MSPLTCGLASDRKKPATKSKDTFLVYMASAVSCKGYITCGAVREGMASVASRCDKYGTASLAGRSDKQGMASLAGRCDKQGDGLAGSS